jgi:hypothetical protein
MAKAFDKDTGGALTTNLVGWWNFEGNSNDEFGTNNGTDTSITYNTSNGKINQGAGFNGSTSKISLSSVLSGVTAFSLAVWVKPAATGAFQRYISRQGGNYLLLLRATDTNHFQCQFNVQPANTATITGTTTISSGTGYFVVATWDGTTLKLFVNGSSDATGVTQGGTMVVDTTQTLEFGHYDASQDFFNGAGDLFGIWSKALSATEISDLYNSAAGNAYRDQGLSVNVSDSITISESVSLDVQLNPNVNDAITVSESVNVDVQLNPTVSESITVSEFVSLDFIRDISVFDSISVSESVLVDNSQLGDVFVNDAIVISESIVPQMDLGDISVSDSITVSENIGTDLQLDISLNETILVSEFISVDNSRLGDISISESITVSENISVTVMVLPKGLIIMRSKEQNRVQGMDPKNGPITLRPKDQNRPTSLDDKRVM